MCLCAIYICVSMCVVCVYTCDAFVHDHLCVLMTCKVCVVPVGVRMAHVCVDLYVEVWHVFCETPLHELWPGCPLPGTNSDTHRCPFLHLAPSPLVGKKRRFQTVSGKEEKQRAQLRPSSENIPHLPQWFQPQEHHGWNLGVVPQRRRSCWHHRAQSGPAEADWRSGKMVLLGQSELSGSKMERVEPEGHKGGGWHTPVKPSVFIGKEEGPRRIPAAFRADQREKQEGAECSPREPPSSRVLNAKT